MPKIIYKNCFECFVYEKNILAVGHDHGLGLSGKLIDNAGMTQEEYCEYFYKEN